MCLLDPQKFSDNTQFRCLKYVTLIPSIWLLITNRYTPGLVCVASRPTFWCAIYNIFISTDIALMPGVRARWQCFGFVLDCKQISCLCTQNSFSCLLTVSLNTADCYECRHSSSTISGLFGLPDIDFVPLSAVQLSWLLKCQPTWSPFSVLSGDVAWPRLDRFYVHYNWCV